MEDSHTLVIITVFYLVVFVTGIIGNLSVCNVIIRSCHLHTAMNYYLVSLACSDLMIIVLGINLCPSMNLTREFVGVPNELLIYWHQYPYPFGETFCKVRSFLSEG